MERKTKKMVSLESDLKIKKDRNAELGGLMNNIGSYKPITEAGKTARDQAYNDLGSERGSVQQEIKELEALLEVATVDMMSGKDTDFSEPTPTSALRDAS